MLVTTSSHAFNRNFNLFPIYQPITAQLWSWNSLIERFLPNNSATQRIILKIVRFIQIQIKLYKGFAHIVRANGLWLSTGKMQKNFHHATHLIAVVTPQGRSIMSKNRDNSETIKNSLDNSMNILELIYYKNSSSYTFKSKGKFTKNIMMWQTWSSRRYNCIVWLSGV